MSLWETLVRDNPVIKESQRTSLQRLNPREWQTSTTLSVSIIGVAYILLVTLALQAVRDIDASLFLYCSLIAAILATAVVLYGSLAGEREKRTLDLLLVAPVTASQIVIAKIFRYALPVLLFVLLLAAPAIVFAIARSSLGLAPIVSGVPFVPAFLGSIALILSVSVFITGLTMLVSSMNRTTSGALIGTLALIFVVYIVSAVAVGVIGSVSKELSDVLIRVHPVAALSELLSSEHSVGIRVLVASFASVAHLVLGIWFVSMASRNVERERKKGISPSA